MLDRCKSVGKWAGVVVQVGSGMLIGERENFMAWYDKVLGVMASADWVTPSRAIGDMVSGDGVGVGCAQDDYGYWVGVLHDNGIGARHATFYGDDASFVVDAADAERVKKLMGVRR